MRLVPRRYFLDSHSPVKQPVKAVRLEYISQREDTGLEELNQVVNELATWPSPAVVMKHSRTEGAYMNFKALQDFWA